jgi:hypothetical protein
MFPSPAASAAEENPCVAMSKFADFLKENKIDPRRVHASSKQVEGLRPEDRALKLARRNSKSEDSDEKKVSGPKPRSGRIVTPRLMTAATTGGKVSGPAKTRLLRAVNRILTQRKQEPVSLKALF